MRLNRSHFQRAFTLVEIMVVVVIIAILIGILVPTLSGARRNAQKTAATFQLGGLRQSLAQYFSDFNMFPPSSPLIPGSTTPIYNSITAGRGASMLAEGLLGYLPGNLDGAGVSAGDSNDFGFRARKSGAGMSAPGQSLGQISGPYAPYDPKSFNGSAFIDPWGHDILYYVSSRSGPSAASLPVATSIFGNTGITNLFNSDDCIVSQTPNPSGTGTLPADPVSLISANSPKIKGFWPLIAVDNSAPTATAINTVPAPKGVTGVTGTSSYLLISAGPDETYFSSGNVVVSK